MRFFKRAVLALFGLFVVWFGLACSHLLPVTTDVQRKALAIMAAPSTTAKGAHNAFPALWLAGYDIPAADMDKVMAADLARYRDTKASDKQVVFVSTAKGHYREQPNLELDSSLSCNLHADDCLAQVRRHADEIRPLLAHNAWVVDRMRALEGSDHYRALFPDTYTSPMPGGLQFGRLQVLDAASRFADGDHAEGLARACSVAGTWRRLATHSDNLIVQMVGVAVFHAAADLFADMLAETPADAALPESCTSAFAPMAESDLSLCDTMKREFRVTASMMDQVGANGALRLESDKSSPVSDFFGGLLFNVRATNAMRAVDDARYCTADPDIQREVARVRSAQWWQVGGWQGALFNPIGSILAGMAAPAYNDYTVRMQDIQRMNQLVRAALALRSEVAATKAGASFTPEARSLPDGVTFDASQRLLHMRRAFHRSDESADFTVPLPGSRVH
jgi:hypothetical protein